MVAFIPPEHSQGSECNREHERELGLYMLQVINRASKDAVNDTSSTSKVKLALGQAKPQRLKFGLLMRHPTSGRSQARMIVLGLPATHVASHAQDRNF